MMSKAIVTDISMKYMHNWCYK